MDDLTSSIRIKDAKISDFQGQLSLLQAVVNKSFNQSDASTRLMVESRHLREENIKLVSARAQDLTLIEDLKSQLRQAVEENKLGTARVRQNVSAALLLASEDFEEQKREVADQLSRKSVEAAQLAQKCRELEQEMARLRSQHEDTITKIAQRKPVSADTAELDRLRKKCAELQEIVSQRDEDSMRGPARGRQTSPSSRRQPPPQDKFKYQSIMKKMKIGD